MNPLGHEYLKTTYSFGYVKVSRFNPCFLMKAKFRYA